MNLPDKFSSKYKGSCQVTIDKCSVNSKIRITDLMNLLQAVAGKHSDLGGMSYFDMQLKNQAWVLSSMRIEIEKLPQWHETIEIETWIETLAGIKTIRDFDVFLNDEKIIGGNSLWVVLNTEKRRPEAIAISHDHLEKYPEKKATLQKFGKIDLSQNAELVSHHKVVFSDLDALNHVNNVKYIEWCLDCLPIDILEKNLIKAIDINYLKEVTFNQKAAIYSLINGKKIYFYIKLDEIVCFAMKLELTDIL
ncbi:MAG: thioesterase [Myroides sp.]